MTLYYITQTKNKMTNIKIKVSNLHKSFGNHNVLDGIDLEVKEGSSMVILGGSGTGKSVLIKTIVGLLTPDSGKVEIDGVDTTYFSGKARFRIMEKCGFLFQAGALFDSLTIEDNITFFAEKLNKLSSVQKRNLAAEKLHAVGLHSNVLNLLPAELSGGMQKRVALARAIANDPEIIFFDEPTTGLDPIMKNVISELIAKFRKEFGTTTITITHDIDTVKKIASKVALLYNGKIVWSGPAQSIYESDNAIFDQFIHGRINGPIKIDGILD